MRILNLANHETVNKQLAKMGLRRNIPEEYGYTLPMDSIAEIKLLDDTLFINDKVDEVGNTRVRKMELVNTVHTLNFLNQGLGDFRISKNAIKLRKK